MTGKPSLDLILNFRLPLSTRSLFCFLINAGGLSRRETLSITRVHGASLARQFAGVLEHICGDGEVMDRAVARVFKLLDEKFMERVSQVISGAPQSGQIIPAPQPHNEILVEGRRAELVKALQNRRTMIRDVVGKVQEDRPTQAGQVGRVELHVGIVQRGTNWIISAAVLSK